MQPAGSVYPYRGLMFVMRTEHGLLTFGLQSFSIDTVGLSHHHGKVFTKYRLEAL